jgi:hypothetical protein
VLFLVGRATAPEYTPAVFPLELSGAPAEITQGGPATVTVAKYTTSGIASAASGVAVKGSEATVTTNASGNATVKSTRWGPPT